MHAPPPDAPHRTTNPCLLQNMPRHSRSPAGVCVAPHTLTHLPELGLLPHSVVCHSLIPHLVAHRSHTISCALGHTQPPSSAQFEGPFLPPIGGVARCAPWLEQRGSGSGLCMLKWWCQVGGRGDEGLVRSVWLGEGWQKMWGMKGGGRAFVH